MGPLFSKLTSFNEGAEYCYHALGNVQIPHWNSTHFVEDLCKDYCLWFQAVGTDMDIVIKQGKIK